ncbi:hypothetical protein PAXRUDRAFT_824849 [Paxillus rubicundulus Ve08.2h10]|uniref:BRCT domain-containing protein n=1 Tax=Paxillus rubicundulus Ve08.2h10 TaxID=930991 RepID=A0A0D0E199_9AGAM|nr:hypothetical protein PAXRUDRAFT_824849 [Paxillus rubicundulus Ve08.2h10]
MQHRPVRKTNESRPSKGRVRRLFINNVVHSRHRAQERQTSSGARIVSSQPSTSLSTSSSSQHLARPETSMPTENRYYRRSPSLPSQDSFGGSISQDPLEQYLASTKQFDVPLSHLGETPTQEVIHPDTNPDVTLPDASEHKEFLEVAMRKYEATRANMSSTSSADRIGNILVAATPSNSGDSAGPSQHKDDFSFRRPDRENASQESTQPFDFDQSPSSFDRLLDQGLVDPREPTPEPTQPIEPEPTPANVSVVVEPLTMHAATTTDGQSNRQQRSESSDWIAPTLSAVVAASNPRSLLRMVDPYNAYRIAKMRQMAGDVEPPSYVTTAPRGTEGQPSRVQETQPYHVEETAPFNPPPSAQPTPRKDKLPAHHRGGGEYQEPGDALDVVPDSEPLRAGPSAPTPGPTRDTGQGPSKKPFCPISPMSEHESGDIVPTSYEVEDQSEDDDDDVPLAVKAASKGAAIEASAVLRSGRNMRSRHPRSAGPSAQSKAPLAAAERHAGNSTSSNVKGKNAQRETKSTKKESVEMPTSLPEQDLQGRASSPKQLPHISPSTSLRIPASKKKKGRAPPPEPSRTRTTSTTTTTTTTTGKKRPFSSDTEGSEAWSHRSTEDVQISLPKAQKEEEEATDDPADEHDHDHNMDVDSPPPLPKKSVPSHKKRCVEDTKPSRGMSKASTSTRCKRSETPVTSMRSVKRPRSGMSSNRALVTERATRVFALWKQDGHYYSGTIYSHGLKTKYLVKFDDGTEDEVELKNMRRCELVAGDHVIVIQDNVRGNVNDVSQLVSNGLIQVEVDQGAETATCDVELRDIRIANRTLQTQWKTRMLTAEVIVTVVKPKPLLDTTPSKQSLVSTISGKAQRELVKTGFVVTLSPRNANSDKMKNNAMLAIKQHGGLVVDDWSNVFTMEGKHSQSNKRWAALPEDLRWKSEARLDRVFLLSDDANQKPKFLLALALGIPCLSFEWLTKAGKFSSDWQPFLLPAGYSDTLGARISQLVDLDWGNCIEHLTDIMANRVASKLFSQKTVLCVGAEFVPLPPHRSRKNLSEVERSREASRIVPWIILCMGAMKVEAVTDTKQVSASQMQSFNYIIAKERENLEHVDLGNVVVGDVNWVKECLISSRMLPPE